MRGRRRDEQKVARRSGAAARGVVELFAQTRAAEPINVVDRHLRYTLWNRGMELLTRVPADQVLGVLVTDVFPFYETNGARARLELALGGEMNTGRHVFRFPTSPVFTQTVRRPVYGTSERIEGVVSVVRWARRLLPHVPCCLAGDQAPPLEHWERLPTATTRSLKSS